MKDTPERPSPVPTLLPDALTPRGAFLFAALAYILVTGFGVVNDGYHSDDWRHITGASPLWTSVEGRWLLEVIFRDLLGERFLQPVQLALAFPCLYWVALCLARHAAPATLRPAATLAIFLIGTHHLYMADVLSFAANIFAYPFALALSVAAFEVIDRSAAKSRGQQALAVILAAQLLAFSIAIYQTFAIAGLIVPVLVLIGADRRQFGDAVRLAVIGALASVAAIGLYIFEWHLYAAATGVEIETRRFQAADGAGVRAKLTELPSLIRSLHTGTLMKLPFGLRAAMGLFSLFALGLLVLATVFWNGTARVLAAARMAIGAGLAFFVFPIVFWLGYEGDSVPARAFGYIGFWTSAVFIAGLTLAAGQLPRIARGIVAAGSTAVAALAIALSLASSAFWSDSARVGQRDEDLARAIYARLVTLPGYPGPPFRIVGGLGPSDLSWGTLAGWTSFHAGNPTIGVFRELYGLSDYTASLPVSPRACTAFPADGSAFVHEGMAYVCLEPFEPFADDLSCAPLPDGAEGRICLGPRTFFHVARTCLETGDENPELWVAFHRSGRSHAAERSFSVASFAIPLGEECYTAALLPPVDGLERLGLRLVAPDGAVLWQGDVSAEALLPPLPR